MTESELLLGIREDPANRTRRLVCADWYEEQGQTERAEFIRVQCALSELPKYDLRRCALQARERRLLAANHKAWWHDWELAGCHRNGFLEELRAPSPQQMAEGIEEAFRKTPIRSLTFEFEGPSADLESAHSIAALSELRYIRDMHFHLGGIPNDPESAIALLRSPHLRNLQRLEFGQSMLIETWEEEHFRDAVGQLFSDEISLGRLSWRNCLQRLTLTLWSLDDAVIRPLIEVPFPSLRALRIESMSTAMPSRDVSLALLRSSLGQGLRELEMYIGGDAGAETWSFVEALPLGNLKRLAMNIPCHELARRGDWGALESLMIFADGEEDLQALLQCPEITKLRRLELPGSQLDIKSLRDLAFCPYLSELKALDLRQNPRLGDEAIEALLASPYLRNLQYLDLSGTDISAEALSALLTSPIVRNLRVLFYESRRRIPGSVLEAIADSKYLSSLTTLVFGQAFDDVEFGLSHLIECETVPNLTFLDFWTGNLKTNVKEMLRKSAIAWPGHLRSRKEKPEHLGGACPFDPHFDGRYHLEWEEPFFAE